MPVLFRVTTSQAPLAIGQTLKITAHTSQTVRGMAVPRSALQRLPSGDTIVWLHDQAERFTPHIVSTVPLNDNTVIVIKGLQDGDRVLTEGASLLSQVR
jgi:cobalt-zinc-cadmium efflux system membrane fusion protein